ncbi:MAG: T9SS type A sorting domain-containing protein [Bacteroidia bacterium]|jgi:hypothetical protein
MKKNTLISIFFLLAFIEAYSQNLIVNPSFEDVISCPPQGIQLSNCFNWYAYRQSPDYFNACVDAQTGFSVPSNALGYQSAATGSAYTGMFCYGTNGNDSVLREYLGAEITTPLVIGQKYYVSLKVNLSSKSTINCRTNNIGVLFSTISYRNLSNSNNNVANPAPIKNFAQVYIPTIVTDTLNWINISGAFVADSAYQYIIIGNFFDNQHTSHLQTDTSPFCKSYYLVDDICVSTDSMTCMGSTGINEQYQQLTQLSIFPNPSNETFNITLPTQQTFTLSVTDISGRTVYTNKNATGTAKVDCSTFSPGIYFVKAINERTVLTGKLIKQ